MFYSPSAILHQGQRGQAPEDGADRTGDDVGTGFEAILPQEAIDCLCLDCEVIARQRKMTLGMWVRAMVIAAGTPGGVYPADILWSCLEFEVPQVARAAFSRGFDEPLERFMAALAECALAYARAPQVDLADALGGLNDGYIVDSTTVRVRGALHGEFPGTGEYAAIKVHTVLSVGCWATVRSHVSPAREPESHRLTIDASWRGCSLLADRANARLAQLRACHDHGALCHPPPRLLEAQG